MLVFALCLAGAGAVLGLYARLPILIAVLALAGLTVAVTGGLGLLGIVTPPSMPGAFLVAVLAPQAGYGIAVVVRGGLATYRSRGRALPARSADEQEIL